MTTYAFNEPVATPLPRTCKAIHNEARLVALSQNQHRFWLYGW